MAGSQIYGGQSRLAALTSLYPKLVTKEKLLSSTELEPFMNFSSQVIALLLLLLLLSSLSVISVAYSLSPIMNVLISPFLCPKMNAFVQLSKH